MLKCSPEAYAKCPDRQYCGSLGDAVFTENSECDKFNQQVEKLPITNADRIRTMSDEELAEWFRNANSVCECCAIRGNCEEPLYDFVCAKNVLEWFGQKMNED